MRNKSAGLEVCICRERFFERSRVWLMSAVQSGVDVVGATQTESARRVYKRGAGSRS
jgi:hypothetical protein